MNFEEGLALTQERLESEARSLGELLDQLRRHIAPVLIGDRDWEGVLKTTRALPPTMAAFPFGFELPLHDGRAGADLGLSLVGGTSPGDFFKKKAQAEEANSSTARISRLLAQTEPKDSELRQVIGRKLMLEYDIASAPGYTRPEPGIFLRPAERPIVGNGRHLEDVRIVLNATVAAAGWQSDPAEGQVVERVYLAQRPEMRIDSFGAFPSRERAIRLAVTGVRNSREIATFLGRAGWPGTSSFVASTVSRFEERGGFVSVGVHFDVLSSGLGPTLGLSFLAKDRRAKDPRYWLDGADLWTTFMSGLHAGGLAVPEKLSALACWSPGPTTLFGKSGPFVLLRGIHHIKLALNEDRIEQVKAYPYMVLIGAAPS